LNSATEQVGRANRIQIIAAGLALFGLWFVLCRHLSGEWSVNEQYSYGWFVPFFAAFLFWQRWEDRTQPGRSYEGGSRKGGVLWTGAVVALLLLLPVRLFEIANPDWRALAWLHAGTVVAITLLIIWFEGGTAWVRHFAFPVCFILVAVPWITPIEEPIVQGLMRTVAAVATETISLFGIPAQLEGNLIRVSTGLVGVNEACSGVRSLQTSLMIGLLFGELKRLSAGRRIVLVLGAVTIAIIANFGRALFLVWVAATESVSAVERWHDLAGYVIVAVVFGGSLALSAVLNRDKVGSRKEELRNKSQESRIDADERSPRFLLPTSYFLIFFLSLLAIEGAVESWYRMHERGLVVRQQWSAKWPEKTEGFREVALDETTRRLLRFDEGRGAAWRVKPEIGDRRTEMGPPDMALLYFFRWQPGKNSALLANLHRPDVCLPAAGWVQVADHGVKEYSVTPTLKLPFRHFVFAQNPASGPGPGRQRFAHAFYCLREDRARATADDTAAAREQLGEEPSRWTRNERISLVVEGRRHLGQQVMEFVLLSGKEMGAEEAEGRFGRLIRELVAEGK
jgi:exosortase